MEEIMSLREFIQRNSTLAKREADFEAKKADLMRLNDLLRSDGREMSVAIFDFLAAAFVDIADGAVCEEMHKEFENTEIWITLKRRKNEK